MNRSVWNVGEPSLLLLPQTDGLDVWRLRVVFDGSGLSTVQSLSMEFYVWEMLGMLNTSPDGSRCAFYDVRRRIHAFRVCGRQYPGLVAVPNLGRSVRSVYLSRPLLSGDTSQYIAFVRTMRPYPVVCYRCFKTYSISNWTMPAAYLFGVVMADDWHGWVFHSGCTGCD